MRPVVTGATLAGACEEEEDGFVKEPRLLRVCLREGTLSRELVVAVVAAP